jgi:hypothetical protein
MCVCVCVANKLQATACAHGLNTRRVLSCGGRAQDIARFVALAGTEEFTGIDALPEAVLEPAPALEQQQRTYSTNNAYAVHGDNSSAHAAAAGSMLADAPVVAQSPKRRAASPTRCVCRDSLVLPLHAAVMMHGMAHACLRHVAPPPPHTHAKQEHRGRGQPQQQPRRHAQQHGAALRRVPPQGSPGGRSQGHDRQQRRRRWPQAVDPLKRPASV